MPQAPIPPDEMFRLATLREYNVVEMLSTPQLDRITRVAAQVMRAELSGLSLIDKDRQWLKAATGSFPAEVEPRDISFCAHGLQSDDMLLVSDASLDPRFADNRLVLEGSIKSYFGAPVIAPNGMRLGMLCAASPTPAPMPEPDQLAALRDLATMAVYEIEATRLRRSTTQMLAAATDEVERLRDSRQRLERAQDGRREFLATLSHELRTPLHSIIGYAGMISDASADDENIARYAAEVETAGKHLSGVVNDLLMFVRKPEQKAAIRWQRLDLGSMAERSASLVSGYAFRSGVSVKVTGTRNLSLIPADESKLTQVLLQLLTNAIRASVAGGDVHVAVGMDHCGWATVTIANTGAVFTPLAIAQALTPLGLPCAAGGEGTGLGLPICQLLIEQQQGRLEITSDPHRGTVATLRLPYLKRQTAFDAVGHIPITVAAIGSPNWGDAINRRVIAANRV